MSPLELLFERDGLPRFTLSTPLSTRYDGDFGIDGSHTYANFVSSLDGVVADALAVEIAQHRFEKNAEANG